MWKEEQYLRCATCNLSVKERDNFYLHQCKKHMKVKCIYCCSYCKKEFSNDHNRNTHEFRCTKKVNIKCKNCTQVFSTVTLLEEHNKKGCSEETKRIFGCRTCTKHFTSEHGLQRHSYYCDGEMICQRSQKIFSSKFNLEHHFKTCVYLLVCDICCMRCQTIELLQAHVATKHKDQVKYPCETCGDVFST